MPVLSANPDPSNSCNITFSRVQNVERRSGRNLAEYQLPQRRVLATWINARRISDDIAAFKLRREQNRLMYTIGETGARFNGM
jgi:hypothetical protein